MLTWLIALIAANVIAITFFLVFWLRDRRTATVKKILSSGNPSVPSFNESIPRIELEISRARRFHHRLSVVLFRLSDHDEGKLAEDLKIEDKEELEELRFLFLGSLLRDELRAYDIVTYDTRSEQYVVVLIESSREQGHSLVKRLKELSSSLSGLELSAGIAEFPYNGLIIEDLVVKANEDFLANQYRKVNIKELQAN